MKIDTNFVVAPQPTVRLLQVLGWLAASVLLLLALWLLVDGYALRTEMPDLRERVARLAVADPPAAAQLLTTEQELARTRERVARLNALARTAAVPSAVLLREIETLLPAEAWLVRWHYRAADGALSLVAAAPRAEPLSVFLARLERSPWVEQALLLREAQAAERDGSRVQFEIQVRVRS